MFNEWYLRYQWNLRFKFSYFSTCHRVKNYIMTYKFE
jgi:hypothetical protein